MVVFVAREGQSVALDGIGKKTGGLFILNCLECLQHGLHAVASKIGHQRKKFRVVVIANQRCRTGPRANVIK